MAPRAPRLLLDAGELRDALAQQWRLVAELLAAWPPSAWEAPTRLGTWTGLELAAHTARGPAVVVAALAAPAPRRPATTATAWLAAAEDVAADVDERARADADAARDTDVGGQAAVLAGLRAATAQALAGVDDAPAGRVVEARLGAVTLADLLATRVVEAAVHTLDLAQVTPGLPWPPGAVGWLDPTAAAVATRVLTTLVAARAPGRSVELRVHDAALRVGAAVQCVEGPTHTRGTPPAVVEVSGAAVWLELATGRRTFAAEVAAGTVRASGERSDLSGVLPVLR